ncbi:MAG: tetratricopeptide repeat protein [Bdellovibrionota bacterium]
MKRILFLLFPLSAMAAEAPVAVPLKPAALPQYSVSERNDLYQESGMDYAKGLYLKLDGSPEDEVRGRKSEALNSRVRERGILKLEKYLAKNKDKNIRRELLHRLSQMHEQQADVTSRRSDVKNKEASVFASLRASNVYLELLRKEYPSWSPDAVLFNLAENHSKLKENDRAEKYYREVIARFPKSSVVADSLLSLGNLYFERQGFQAARGFFDRILQTSEVNLYPYAHYKMAWCYFNESNFPSAVARLEQAIYDSRKLQTNGTKKLGVEDEALSDLVLFFAEYGNPDEAKTYFEKLVTKEKANELRYNLAQRLFDHGKHLLARNVAKQLLNEEPQKEYVNRLYLILISVAERLKDRDGGLETEQKLSKWIKTEKLAKEDVSRNETEEYMRQYSQKLHYEAETMKQTEVWAQAKKSYEIYLETFPDETETAEVKFRYAVLLMNRKEEFKAYQTVSEALAKMDNKHARYKEALRLKIQSIELSKAEDRKKMPDADLLATYDAYATNFSAEDLGVQAAYKAAGIAKNLETPELVAARFRTIAENFPKHALAKAALQEALSVLVKAEKWEALRSESKIMAEKSEIQSGLGADDELKKKIAEASELSQVKIAEGLEAQGKPDEAKAHYERILAEKPSDTLGVYAFVRMASLDEKTFHKNRDAIMHYEGLRERYPAAKESRQAALELARLYEKVNEPMEAVARYQAFAGNGSGKMEIQALTNVAVILESLGEREQAADAFYKLNATMRAAKAPEKDQLSALEAGCNNSLLSSHQNRDKKTMQRILDCAKQMAAADRQPLVWQARAAWAMDQMADSLQAEAGWKKLAAHNLKATPEAERAYVAMGKVKLLAHSLEDFKVLKFSEKNERPEANIGNKTKSLEEFEKLAENVIKIGTPKQIVQARNMLRLAYLDFAETMETAAVPSKLSDAEKVELKKSFVTFAKDFHDRATALEAAPGTDRAPASVAAEPQFKIGSLSNSDENLLKSGDVPNERAVEIFAKKAYDSYKNGRFGEARYFGEKWKRQLASSTASAEYSSPELDRFQAALAEKLPEVDPLTRDLF